MKNFKIINLFTFSLLTIYFLVSCGGSKVKEEKDESFEYPIPPTVTIKAESKISGELSNYIKITDIDYKLEFNREYNQYIAVTQLKLKFVSRKNYPENKEVFLHASVLDESGVPFNEIKMIARDEKIVSLLKQGGNQEEWISFESGPGVRIHFEDSISIVNFFEKVKKATTITVSTEIYTSENNSNSANENNSTTGTDNSENTDNAVDSNSDSNENWDEALASYEKYTNDYIALVKKMKKLKGKTDNSSVMEYTSLMTDALKLNQDAQEFGTKMEDAKSDLTPTQLAKYMKIQLKLTAAIAELSY